MMLRRHLVVVVLAFGVTLYGGGVASVAQTSGSELAEAIGADATGDDSYAAVTSVDPFSAQGGEAVFEPGTPYEEVFTYSGVDAEASRLLGLTRQAPLAHSEGVFVQASPAEESATPSPSATETDAPPEGQAHTTDEAGSPAETLTPDEKPDPTVDVELPGTPSTPDALEQLVIPGTCGATDPTCDGILAALIGDPVDALCDPSDTGQTCQQFLASLLFGRPLPTECVGETCDILQDPLGPWSVCDVDDTGEQCPDPDDLIDLVWSVDSPLSNLKCTASVSGPSISDGGGMVRGKGSFDCGEGYVGFIEITVCLYRASGGAWVKMGCRHKEAASGGVPGSIEQKISEPCVKQQTATYRIRARGHAQDGLEPQNEDRDTAKATATLYCPGPSAEGASLDAIEYAESWL